MMQASEIQPWFFRVEPFEGESISHFLGRFRRANELTPSGLGKSVGLAGTIARWEKFRFNPPPTEQQLKKVAGAVGVSLEQLRVMFPPQEVGMKLEPIRLCGACYREKPCHQMQWQFKETQGCDRHQLRLLAECPNCRARFTIPALWVEGSCQRCFTTFAEMVSYQKSF